MHRQLVALVLLPFDRFHELFQGLYVPFDTLHVVDGTILKKHREEEGKDKRHGAPKDFSDQAHRSRLAEQGAVVPEIIERVVSHLSQLPMSSSVSAMRSAPLEYKSKFFGLCLPGQT